VSAVKHCVQKKSKGEKIMTKKLWIAVFATLLGSASIQAENILVASSRSNSIEQFSTAGVWMKTFATTGPYAPVALAQSPVTGEVFATTMWGSGPYAGQLTNRILRYQADGHFDTNWDTFTIECAYCPTTATQSLLFDPSGNLWVATAFGKDLGGSIYVFEYLAADLTSPNPHAQPVLITAPMYRGNQMAFNMAGNLCIAGFIDQDVMCFNTSTGALTADYYAEIHASSVSPVIEPVGLAFDGNNRMYLTSVFGGQVVKEVNPGGPIVLLATPTTAPNELSGNLVLRGTKFYTTSIFPPPPSPFSTPDSVYAVSANTGLVTPFISGTAAPGLGNDHIWGACWMIFHVGILE
jgi:hypothetical protein